MRMKMEEKEEVAIEETDEAGKLEGAKERGNEGWG